MEPGGGELHLSVSLLCVSVVVESALRARGSTPVWLLSGKLTKGGGGFHRVACIKKIASFSQVSNEPGIGENG